MTDERKAYYWLSICGLTVQKQNALLEVYKTPLAVLKNIDSRDVAEFAGSRHEAMKRFADEKYITDRLVEINKQGIKLLVRCMPEFPEKLLQSEVSPPLALYYRGNISLLNKDNIAVVGTRHSDDYGKCATEKLVSELAKKLVVVTGHATGIDGYAAQYALDAGGSVIIIAGCGIEQLTQPRCVQNAAEDKKLILSEYEPTMPATKYTFPERNRLIAGIAGGVIVVQAAEKSGALITAGFAAEQGRNVYAVPGSILSDRCKGTNKLIEDGAAIITSAKTVFDDMNIQYAENRAEVLAELTDEERTVCDFLKSGKRHVDDIIKHLSRPPHEVFALLSEMELGGKIQKKISNFYEL